MPTNLPPGRNPSPFTKVPARNPSTFPLKSLFLLTGVFGVLFAAIAPAVQSVADGKLGIFDLGAAMFAGGTGASMLGTVIGLYHHQRLLGALVGFVLGLVFGVFLGAMALAAGRDGGWMTCAMGASAIITIVIAFVMRLRQFKNQKCERYIPYW